MQLWKVTVTHVGGQVEYWTVKVLPSFIGTQESVIWLTLDNDNRVYVTVANMLDMLVVPIPNS